MKIAQVAPCWLPVPPPGYGGIEAMLALLTDGLVDRGHEVTLFASADSRTKAKLVSHYDSSPGTCQGVKDPFYELPHVLVAYESAGEFDIIHDHTFPLGPCIGAHLGHPPIIHTVHGPPSTPALRSLYRSIGRRVHLVAISDFQRHATPELNYESTIYNGIAVEDFACEAPKEDYLLFIGRMSPEKGAHLAVEAARAAGRRLVLAAKLEEPGEIEYFEQAVRPKLGRDAEYVGEATYRDKIELYSKASATLMPIQWPEPFGLVMVESMACGTPVVALRNGSVDEVVDEGITGLIADEFDDFVELISHVEDLDPKVCRRHARSRFSADSMVDAYEHTYSRLVCT